MQPVADPGVVASDRHDGGAGGTPARPWIGVQFVCAGKYVRVFRRGDGSGYLARCPTCGKLDSKSKSKRETLDAGYSAPVEPGLEPLP